MAQKRSRADFEADLQAQQSPYVFFGTPLPPLDPYTRDDGSYVPVWKQEVTDERGRKRLHGAFTGGFSAGYFNSVGSKEGWTPQTFVSSRTNRAKATQRAEDYMDDEDLADAEEAKVLETKGGFSGFGSTEDDVGAKGHFMDVFRTTQDESMGLRLLRKMGWTDGQAIGSGRMRARSQIEYDPGGKDSRSRSSPTASKIISFVRKTDARGLGLGEEPGMPTTTVQITPISTSLQTLAKKTKVKAKRTGFGVGVLNDNDSDDEDPFEMGPKLALRRLVSERKKRGDNGLVVSSSNPLLASKPTFVKKAPTISGFRRCHDGKLPLGGFILSVNGPVVQEKKYPSPKIPEGWVPARQAASPETDSASRPNTVGLAKTSTLNQSSRAALLGETLLPGQSVFDFLSAAARDKLASASNNQQLPAGKYVPPDSPSPVHSETSVIPMLDPKTAASALQRTTTGFVPYSDNPEKLARYRYFLTYRTQSDSVSGKPAPQCPPELPQEDFAAELQEFANAAAIFKPMSGTMANRFTSANSGATSSATIVSKDEDGNDLPLLSKGGRQLAPEEEAAEVRMYGPLTRVTTTVFPTRLLCKRFGVLAPVHVQPEPNDGSVAKSSGDNGAIGGKGAAGMLVGFGNRFTGGGVQSSESEGSGKRSKIELLGKRDMDNMRKAAGLPALGEVVRRKDRELVVDPNRNEALEAERPSEETFKQIFEDD